MVHVIKKVKATVSHKLMAAKDTAARLAFYSRHILSTNAGEGYIDTAIKSCWPLSLAPYSLRGSTHCLAKPCYRL